MNILIWVLIVSAVAVIFMISYKYYEITTGKNFIPDNIRRKFNILFFKSSIIFRDRFKKMSLTVKSHTSIWPFKFYDFLHKNWVIFRDWMNEKFDRLRKQRYLDKN